MKVSDVTKGGLAAAKGIKDGQYITKINGISVIGAKNNDDLDDPHAGSITLSPWGDNWATPVWMNRPCEFTIIDEPYTIKHMVTVQPLSPLNIEFTLERKGLKINSIGTQSLFSNTNIKPGMIITHVNKRQMYTPHPGYESPTNLDELWKCIKDQIYFLNDDGKPVERYKGRDVVFRTINDPTFTRRLTLWHRPIRPRTHRQRVARTTTFPKT